jgi:predicted RNA-binding protein
MNALLPQIPQQTILISAYDYYNLKKEGDITPQTIKESFKNKILFLDSGGFEIQFSHEDKWSVHKYKNVISELDPQFYVGYDRIPSYDKTSNTKEEVWKSLKFLKDYDRNNGRVLLFHFSTKNIPIEEMDSIIELISKHSGFIDIIGFPEREIGANIIQTCRFVKTLRERLDEKQIFKPIHIFGCSDPISITLFVLAGADIFDGVGWIKYAFDKANLRNVERSHLPLLKCDCIACNRVNWSKVSSGEYEYRLLIHNLYNIEEFLYELRNKIIYQKLEDTIQGSGLEQTINMIFESGEDNAQT